jgi:superfamily I DNA/RNA helicase
VPELVFLAALAGETPNGLFFAGDIGQRIFRAPFPWKAAGVDIQGRSRSLKVCYRTSQQIRSVSDLLLPPSLVEADGSEDKRTGIVSLFEGPPPELRTFADPDAEALAAGHWLAERVSEGVRAEEIAVLVRSEAELGRAEEAAAQAGLAVSRIGSEVAAAARIGTMHEAKGGEFRVVAVLACDQDVIPSADRLLEARDEGMIDEIMATERHLLYVAATRARERLWVSGAGTISEFLEDLL